MKRFKLTTQIYNSSIEKINNFPEIDLGNLTDKIIGSQRIITKLEKPDLGQVIPAVPTLFTSNNQIDYNFLNKKLSELAKSGIKEVLVAGTTGLASLMSHEEQIKYIEQAVIIANKYGLKVVAGTGANNTYEQNLLTQQAFKKGAVASLLLAPYYIKASNDMLIKHFIQALNYGPGIIYSIYGRTAIQIPTEVIKELSKHPNFIGVKECDGGNRIKELSNYGIKVWSGNDDQVIDDVHKNGAHGTITVAGNIQPELTQELVNKPKISQETRNYSKVLNNILFIPGYPNPKSISTIEAMKEKFDSIIQKSTLEKNDEYIPGFRLPVGPFELEQQKIIQKILKVLGINTSIISQYKEF